MLETYSRKPSTGHGSANDVASQQGREAGAHPRAMQGCTPKRTRPASGTSLSVRASDRHRNGCRRQFAPQPSPQAVPWCRSANYRRDTAPQIVRHAAAATRPRRAYSTFLYAFDLIEVNGDDLRRDPLEVRKAALASIVAKAGPKPAEILLAHHGIVPNIAWLPIGCRQA
jgi:hypothetical protein